MWSAVRGTSGWIGGSWLILTISRVFSWLLSILIGRLLAIRGWAVCIWLLLERRRTPYGPVPRHATPTSSLRFEIHARHHGIEF